MKYIVQHNPLRLRNIEVRTVKSGSNLFVHIGYGTSNLNAIEVSTMHYSPRRSDPSTVSVCLSKVLASRGTITSVIKLIGENAFEKRRLAKGYLLKGIPDSIHTDLTFIPDLTLKQWEAAKIAKEVKIR